MSREFLINSELDLVLERIVDVPRQKMWEAWTTPAQIKNWFCPDPWRVSDCEMDVTPGGIFHTVFKGPAGEEQASTGCFLEIIPGKKLVWTDSLLPDFRPSGTSFMTGMILFEDHPRGTKYTAIALHKDAATRNQHQDMGFEKGWGQALEQMIAMIKGERK